MMGNISTSIPLHTHLPRPPPALALPLPLHQCKLAEVKEERFAMVQGGKDSLYFESEETQSIRAQLSSPGKERDQ